MMSLLSYTIRPLIRSISTDGDFEKQGRLLLISLPACPVPFQPMDFSCLPILAIPAAYQLICSIRQPVAVWLEITLLFSFVMRELLKKIKWEWEALPILKARQLPRPLLERVSNGRQLQYQR